MTTRMMRALELVLVSSVVWLLFPTAAFVAPITASTRRELAFLHATAATTSSSSSKIGSNSTKTTSNRLEQNDQWIRQRLGISQAMKPHVLFGKGLQGETRIQFYLERLNITEEELSKMLFKKQNLLTYNIEKVQQKLDIFAQRLNLTETADLAKFIKKAPSLLGPRTEVLEAKLEWFEKRFHLTQKQLRVTIVNNPALLHKSVEDNLEPSIQFLEERLSLSAQDLPKYKDCFASCSQQLLEQKLEWFQVNLLVDDQGAQEMIQKFPSLLAYSIENNLVPKLVWYENLLGANNARTRLAHDPSFFSYSIESRLKPRLEELEHHGLLVEVDVPLNSMVKYTPARWDVYLQRRLLDRAKR